MAGRCTMFIMMTVSEVKERVYAFVSDTFCRPPLPTLKYGN